jgi:DtxR family Mn-dependent transcriptional regulator
MKLLDLEVGRAAYVSRVSDRDPALLRYLDELGVRPGVRIALTERGPFDGPLMLRIGGAERLQALGVRVASEIHIRPIRALVKTEEAP